MRLLFLTAQLPEPPHAGGALRTNGLMRQAHAAGHEVHLLSFGEADQWRLNRAALEEFCTRVETVPPPQRTTTQRLRDLLAGYADMQRRFASPRYAEKLHAILQQTAFDIVQVESLEMATYLPIIRHAQPQTPVIYDAFNAEYALQHSIYLAERGNVRRWIGALYSWVQWRRLTHFERRICRSVAHVVAVSDTDAAAFLRLAPGVSVSVVPNGIYADRYAQLDGSLDLGEAAIVFTGSMNYRPNVDAALWFADEVLGRVRAHVPQAKFFVVGSRPHARLNVLRERDEVQITGWVPDVAPFLSAATVYVVPMRMGSGTRLKLLQALAAGKAVVSTSTGAQGLDLRDGRELRLADGAPEFAQAVVDLLQAPAQRKKLGQAGRAFVRAQYDWSVIAPRLLRVYDQVTTFGVAGETARE